MQLNGEWENKRKYREHIHFPRNRSDVQFAKLKERQNRKCKPYKCNDRSSHAWPDGLIANCIWCDMGHL